jgi:ubiquinone/menaquinone biosynthesis C-methylase UbiE
MSNFFKEEINSLHRIFKPILKKEEYNFIKCALVIDLVIAYENIIKKPKNSIFLLKKILKQKKNEYESKIKYYTENINIIKRKHYNKLTTQIHYSALFDKFDYNSIFIESHKLLKKRFMRNNFYFGKDIIKNKTAIDLGCGTGRYTFAIKKFGFKRVIGLDFSKKNIINARKNAKKIKIRNVDFKVADITKIPNSIGKFDFIFSYGVFHHTRSIQKCLNQLKKISNPGAKGFIFLIGQGGIRWSLIQLLRKIIKYTNKEYIMKFMNFNNFKPKTIYLILDHLLVPINTQSLPNKIEKIFKKIKIKKYRRFNRGSDLDDIEKIYQYKKILSKQSLYNIFGCGENRYIIEF